MTRIPTNPIEPQRGAAVAGNGIRGERSSDSGSSGDFLMSLLSFTSLSATKTVTADLRFNQLVGALQLNRPSAPTDARNAERERQPAWIDRQSGLVEESDEDESSADRRVASDRVAPDDEEAIAQWRDPRWFTPPGGNGLSHDVARRGELVGDVRASGRYADQRSDGFPTAERAAELELGRPQGPSTVTAAAAGGDADPNATSYRDEGLARSAVATDTAGGNFRLGGAWQRVDGERLAGGFGEPGNAPRPIVESVGATDLLRGGQSAPVTDGPAASVVERGGSEAGERELGWQLSFQSDRIGVRSGRLNGAGKVKGREGLKPDGGSLSERANRIGHAPVGNSTTEQSSVIVSPVTRAVPQLSLGELSLAPAAARALSESGLGVAPSSTVVGTSGVATGTTEAAMSTMLGVDKPATAPSTPANAPDGPRVTIVDPAPSDLSAVVSVQRGDRPATNDISGTPELAGSLRTLPARVMNQVAEAMRQAPNGDSTMRLQLNPVDLGQLSIEISFRDGVMHGKLRAEQGQTFKLLQDGLDGLKARLSEQGIVVQALEVELGQQGDFSQQSGSFSPGPDFGRQRSGRGYFAADGSARRLAPADRDAAIQPTPRDTSGQWAVNVIV